MHVPALPAEFEQRVEDALNDTLVRYPWLVSSVNRLRFKNTAELLRSQCPPPAVVLDLGAWPGAMTCCLKRCGYEVIAIDKDPERPSIRSHALFARGHIREGAKEIASFSDLCELEGIEVRAADLEHSALPFDSASADAVIFAEVLEHLWVNPFLTLSEINRVLKPGGTLIVSTPNLMALRNRLNFLTGRIDRVIENPFVAFLKKMRIGHTGHLRLYAPAELQLLLRLFGFDADLFYQRESHFDHVSPGPGSSDEGRGLRGGAWAFSVRRVIRPPDEYVSAAWATLAKFIEDHVPRLQPQMFARARKVNDANFHLHFSKEIEQLVLANRL